uniref:Phosphatase tensin-type domain-containing protein n=1 Tax=Ditylenchus dipsaci TaxID=166011 RepID=A0A915DBI0_9BILA
MNDFCSSSSSSSLAATSTHCIVSKASSKYCQDGSQSVASALVSQPLATPVLVAVGRHQQPQLVEFRLLPLLLINEKAHHGSTTSTTFSTGSTMSSTTTNDPIDYSSTASSGVATMSSTDHIPMSNQKSTTGRHNYNFISHSSEEGSDTKLLFLKVSTSSTQTTVCSTVTTAAANSSSSTLSLNTANASADSTLCSGRTNLLRSTSPTSPSLSASQNIPSGSSVFACGTSCSQIICTPLRTMVSQNRRRYQQDGFNLDLTYITDRIIAMGYPADTTEALYRNSMTHIVKFLEHYHPGHYKVFNLRGQYVYDTSKFHNRVVSFEMTDHHPPRLELMAPFCREVHEYLEADPKMRFISERALKVRVANGTSQPSPTRKRLHIKTLLRVDSPCQQTVFLEGDVRIDLFQKSQLQLAKIKLKKQEKKKIGHIWMNTMFSCPGFCGGQYVHGDEAYPYSSMDGESDSLMIVRKGLRRRTTRSSQPTQKFSDSQLPQNYSHNSASANCSMPSSPPFQLHNKVRVSMDNSSTNSTESTHSSAGGVEDQASGGHKSSAGLFEPRRTAKWRSDLMEWLKNAPANPLQSHYRVREDLDVARWWWDVHKTKEPMVRASLDTDHEQFEADIIVDDLLA